MRGLERYLLKAEQFMNPQKENAAMIQKNLETYLARVPDVTAADLEALRDAAEKLDQDPAFQADYLKSRFVEGMLAAMEENGDNQNKLAARWAKTRQYVSKLLNEDRCVNFTIETMCEFAHLVNRRIDIQVVRLSEAAHVIRAMPTADFAAIWKDDYAAAVGNRRSFAEIKEFAPTLTNIESKKESYEPACLAAWALHLDPPPY
jgi:hypothetical protein